MQNMHESSHDGPLAIHWPIHRCRGSGAWVSLSMRAGECAHGGARRGTKAVAYITARVFGSVVDGSVRPGSGFQQNYGNGMLQLDYADTTS